MRSLSLPLVAVAAALLLLVPAADALTVAARGVKARPSEEYSPNTAWELGYHGCGVTVAVFDAGIDDAHPYLAGKVIAGYDATATREMWTAANGGNPTPLQGTHGTPVAGIVASHAGKPFYAPEDAPEYADDDLVGIAPCAWLVDVMFSDVTTEEDIETDMVQAFEWAMEHIDDDWGDDDPSNDGIDVITMSWSPNDGTNGADPVCKAASAAVAAGIVVLGSAGNSGSVEEPDLGCPSGADGVLSIANIGNRGTVDRDDDKLEESSTWGPRTDDKDDDVYEELKPDVAAPGAGVISTGSSLADGTEYDLLCIGPREMPVSSPLVPTCETTFGGTSGATPVVAGTVALMLEANPALTPADVREILHQTAVKQDDMERSAANLSAKWDHRHGYGFLDAHAAVMMALTWPGMELGRDLDADGVRDHLDLDPRDPDVATIVREVREVLPPDVAARVDTDGDLVVDAQDSDPSDAAVMDGVVPAAIAGDEARVPMPGAAAVLTLLAFVALLGRRSAG